MDAGRPPLRIGILGAARIAGEFVRGVGPSETVQVVAVASRDPAKAERFRQEHGLLRSHGSYEALLADPDIEAVYNPLPNSLHAQWSIGALAAGKHVLCEKPLAVSSEQARAMFATARAHGRVLVEGFPYRSQPHSAELRRLVQSGAIGRLVSIQAAFGLTFADAGNFRWDPALGGGAMLDLGTYPVSLVRMLTGQRPIRVHAVADWHASGVDRTVVATLEHASGVLAQVSCSFSTGVHRQATIAGTDGVIHTNYMNNPTPSRPVVLQLRRGSSWETEAESVPVPVLNGFRAEAESFEELVRLGPQHWNGATPEESIDIMVTLEGILESARSGAVVGIHGG